MSYLRSVMPQALQMFLAMAMVLLTVENVRAQGMMGGSQSCPMCGAMGWGGMLLGLGLVLALIAALVALTVFLIRRSRHQH